MGDRHIFGLAERNELLVRLLPSVAETLANRALLYPVSDNCVCETGVRLAKGGRRRACEDAPSPDRFQSTECETLRQGGPHESAKSDPLRAALVPW